MTRKHFNAIAEAIREVPMPRETREKLVAGLVPVMKQLNSRFDAGRFEAACDPEHLVITAPKMGRYV